MLKRQIEDNKLDDPEPAAFGRLCVETFEDYQDVYSLFQPPSGGCVLKHLFEWPKKIFNKPAAFGRLCVETISLFMFVYLLYASRLRAAVC